MSVHSSLSGRIVAGTIKIAAALVVAVAVGSPMTAQAQSREEWIALGNRVHGGFGSFIPVGIRIGLDALRKLDAKPREVTVTFWAGPKAPCACPADGILIATTSSPGQGTLNVSSEKAPEGQFLVAVITHKQSGAAVKYTVAESWMPRLVEMNKTLDPAGRFDAVMQADNLFQVEEMPAKK